MRKHTAYIISAVLLIVTLISSFTVAFAAEAGQYGGTIDANGVLTIDGSVEEIGTAYNSNKNITAIVIKEGVKKINSYAFYGCSNVTSIVLPDGLEDIGTYAFEYCAIEEISIPDSVIKMGQESFNMCAELKSYIQPENVEYYSSMTTMGYGMTALQEFRVTQSMVDNNISFILPAGTWYLSTDATKSYVVSTSSIKSADWGVGTYTTIMPDPDGYITVTDEDSVLTYSIPVYGYVGRDATATDSNPNDPNVAPEYTETGTIVSVSVPTKIIFAAFASDGGEVTAPDYMITNKSAFALKVTLTDFTASETDDNAAVDDKLTLNITGAEMAKADVIGLQDNTTAYGAKLAKDSTWNFSLDGEYTGDFGTSYMPKYSATFQFDLY